MSFTDSQLLPVGLGANILIFHFMLLALTMCSLAASHVDSTLLLKCLLPAAAVHLLYVLISWQNVI